MTGCLVCLCLAAREGWLGNVPLFSTTPAYRSWIFRTARQNPESRQDIRQRVVLKLFLSFAKVFFIKRLITHIIFWANFMKWKGLEKPHGPGCGLCLFSGACCSKCHHSGKVIFHLCKIHLYWKMHLVDKTKSRFSVLIINKFCFCFTLELFSRPISLSDR